MTEQICGHNPILHINLLLLICPELQKMVNKSECKMDSLTHRNLYKVAVKVYIFENHIYTKLPFGILQRQNCTVNNYERHGVLFLRGRRGEGRGEGDNGGMNKVRTISQVALRRG